MTEASRRRTSALRLPLCEVPQAVRAPETEDRMVVSGAGGEGLGSEGLKLSPQLMRKRPAPGTQNAAGF